MENTLLDIGADPEFTNSITSYQYHSHKPYGSNSYKNNDEIKIAIHQQDLVTLPCESYLHINGKLSGKKADGTAATVSLVNNAIPFLFEECRYEISGVEISKTRNVGTSSLIKTLLSARKEDSNYLLNSCWLGITKTLNTGEFSFCIPLKRLLGFFEDYPRIITYVKQELILLRSSTDYNAVVSSDAVSIDLSIEGIAWRLPHLTLSDESKLEMYRRVERDIPIHLAFRSLEIFEWPTLPLTDKHSWSIKSSLTIEKPRFVVLAFQTDRRNKINKNLSEFDSCSLNNVKLYLNSNYHPYDNIHGDWSLFYEMYARFQNSYYGTDCSPIMDINTFKSNCPLYVIDCTKQDDAIKTSVIDVRIDFELREIVKPNTTAYCFLIHDTHMVYTPLSGSVRRMV